MLNWHPPQPQNRPHDASLWASLDWLSRFLVVLLVSLMGMALMDVIDWSVRR